jgi:outer membrane protein OmpA-like peptidoglycan-associated protein
MKLSVPHVLLGLALAGTLAAPAPADAQGALGRLREKAKQKVEEKIDQAVDGKPAEKKSSAPETSGAASSGATSPAAARAQAPGQGAWTNYDFVPGERVVFVDDFSKDRVGNFPQRLEFKGGNMEVVEWQGERWLSDDGHGEFYINLPAVLPERFTMEFGLTGSGNAMSLYFDPDTDMERRIDINAHTAWGHSGAVRAEGALGISTDDSAVKIRISVDGKYVKLYANERRALNAPNLDLGRSRRILVKMNGWSAEQPRMISDLRIMAGGRQLYDALAADGRVATQGIFFDTGSDRIRPESTPTLKEITAMLKEHADLKILVEGHTDNVGQAASNLALSEKRAAAVKRYLVEQGIAEDRLQSKGLGDTKPTAKNDTAEGRQQNRRVELVKI